MNAAAPSGSVDLYRSVRAGFVLQGESLNAWAGANGFAHAHVQKCLKGRLDSSYWRRVRAEIVQAAGLAPDGSPIRRKGLDLRGTVCAGLILRGLNFHRACTDLGVSRTTARRCLDAETRRPDADALIRDLCAMAGVSAAGELMLPAELAGKREAA